VVLGEGNGTLRAVSIDLDTQELRGRAQVAQFEVLTQLGDDILDGRERLGYKGHIIDKDRKDDAQITFGHHIDGCIAIALLETKRLEHRAHFAIPAVALVRFRPDLTRPPTGVDPDLTVFQTHTCVGSLSQNLVRIPCSIPL